MVVTATDKSLDYTIHHRLLPFNVKVTCFGMISTQGCIYIIAIYKVLCDLYLLYITMLLYVLLTLNTHWNTTMFYLALPIVGFVEASCPV